MFGAYEAQNWVVVSNIFYFHPYLGKIPILTNIFRRGWNHQLENLATSRPCMSKAFWWIHLATLDMYTDLFSENNTSTSSQIVH